MTRTTEPIVTLLNELNCGMKLAGTPEAVGKAELVDAIIRDMNRWQGFSIGLAKQLAWLDGSLHKHQAAVHQAGLSAF